MTKNDIHTSQLNDELLDEIMALLGDDTEAGRDLQVAGQRLRAQRIEQGQEQADVDKAWQRFAMRHQEEKPSDEGPVQPRWLKVVRYVLMAAAMVTIIIGIALPSSERSDEGKTAKTEQSLIYKADPKPAPITLTAEGGKAVAMSQKAESEIDVAQAIDALDLSTGEQNMTITIPKGKTYTVTLSDGTKVYMNADSRLTFPSAFVGDRRTVELEGEAYFAVARDTEKPFVVRAGGMETTVLGTEFYLSANPGQPCQVTLLSGAVSVEANGQQATLRPGQQATATADGLTTRSGVDTDRYRYWRDGLLYFDNTDLYEVMCEIGRIYNCNIEMPDSQLGTLKIHFVADRTQTIDQLVNSLNAMERVKVAHQADRLVVTADK